MRMLLLSGLSSFFGSIGKIIIYAVIGIAIIIGLVMLFKHDQTRKYTLYALSIIIIVAGVISCFKIRSTLDIGSREIGTAIHIEMKKDYNVVSEFDLTQISFDSSDFINYKSVISKSSEKFNGTDKNYMAMINEMPAIKTECSAGKVDSTFVINFYDTEEKVLSTAELRIIIEYLSKETRITVSMKNINASVSYFDAYMEINGFLLKVVEGV